MNDETTRDEAAVRVALDAFIAANIDAMEARAREEQAAGTVNLIELVRAYARDFLAARGGDGETPQNAEKPPAGERGYVKGRFVSHKGIGYIVGLAGGASAGGVTPAKATAVVKARNPQMRPHNDRITLSTASVPNCLKVEATGVAAPSWAPGVQDCAVASLVFFLKDGRLVSDNEKIFFDAISTVLDRTDGFSAGMACSTEALGSLTVTATGIDQEWGSIVVDIDVRFPECLTVRAVEGQLRDIAAHACATFETVASAEAFVEGRDEVTPKNLAQALRAFVLNALADCSKREICGMPAGEAGVQAAS